MSEEVVHTNTEIMSFLDDASLTQQNADNNEQDCDSVSQASSTSSRSSLLTVKLRAFSKSAKLRATMATLKEKLTMEDELKQSEQNLEDNLRKTKRQLEREVELRKRKLEEIKLREEIAQEDAVQHVLSQFKCDDDVLNANAGDLNYQPIKTYTTIDEAAVSQEISQDFSSVNSIAEERYKVPSPPTVQSSRFQKNVADDYGRRDFPDGNNEIPVSQRRYYGDQYPDDNMMPPPHDNLYLKSPIVDDDVIMPKPRPNINQYPGQESYDFSGRILELLATLKLPQKTMKKFSGEVTEFVSFKKSFESIVVSKEKNLSELMDFLLDFTCGEARNLIASCQFLPPEDGYPRAWRLLKQHFGQPIKISRSYVSEVAMVNK